MHFKPTLDESEIKDRWKPDYFDPLIEQYHAAMSRMFSDDIAREIEKVEWANLIIFLFPCGGCLSQRF
jgi:NAD(P)H dehydrogenase (quinone)